MRAKKSYGQHFLKNINLAKAIVNSCLERKCNDNILEVGPGRGVLTQYFREEKINFYAVEADPDMMQHLQDKFEDTENWLIYQDFLRLDLTQLFNGNTFNLVGNFPYNISSQIIFKMLDHRDQIPVMIGMFQKELGERVISKNGSKDYGVISVLTQLYYEGKIIHRVSPGSFNPPPKVDSVVVFLKRKNDMELPIDQKFFKTVVKAAFNQRRKMLRNTLKSLCHSDTLLEYPIFDKRPEQLSLHEFIELSDALYNNLPKKTSNEL